MARQVVSVEVRRVLLDYSRNEAVIAEFMAMLAADALEKYEEHVDTIGNDVRVTVRLERWSHLKREEVADGERTS